MEGLTGLFLGVICLFGFMAIIPAIILVWGMVGLFVRIAQIHEPEHRKLIRNPIIISSVSGVALLILAVLFTILNLRVFYGAFPLP